MALGMEVRRPRRLCVRRRPPPLPQRGTDPQFSAHICCGQMDAWIKMALGMQIGLGPGHIVLNGDPAPLPQRGTAPNFRPISVVAKWLDGLRCHLVWTSQKGGGAPQFSAHVYCGQTVGWIKMLFGMEVGLSPGHIVLDGDPALLSKKGTATRFSGHFCCGQTTVCIRIPLGTEVGLSLGDIVLNGDPAPPPVKSTAPNFRPMSVVAKRLHGLRCHFVCR